MGASAGGWGTLRPGMTPCSTPPSNMHTRFTRGWTIHPLSANRLDVRRCVVTRVGPPTSPVTYTTTLKHAARDTTRHGTTKNRKMEQDEQSGRSLPRPIGHCLFFALLGHGPAAWSTFLFSFVIACRARLETSSPRRSFSALIYSSGRRWYALHNVQLFSHHRHEKLKNGAGVPRKQTSKIDILSGHKTISRNAC